MNDETLCTNCGDPECPAVHLARLIKEKPGFKECWDALSDVAKALVGTSYYKLDDWKATVSVLAVAGDYLTTRDLTTRDVAPFTACIIMASQDRAVQVSRETLRGSN